jgi:hypothetical protein
MSLTLSLSRRTGEGIKREDSEKSRGERAGAGEVTNSRGASLSLTAESERRGPVATGAHRAGDSFLILSTRRLISRDAPSADGEDPGSLHFGRDDTRNGRRREKDPGFFPFGFAQGFGGWKRSLFRRALNDTKKQCARACSSSPVVGLRKALLWGHGLCNQRKVKSEK